MPKEEDEKAQARLAFGRTVSALIRYLSYAVAIVTLYIALATIGFSLVRFYPPYGSSALAFGVIAAAIGYLYVSNRKERQEVIAKLPSDEDIIFEEIRHLTQHLIEEETI